MKIFKSSVLSLTFSAIVIFFYCAYGSFSCSKSTADTTTNTTITTTITTLPDIYKRIYGAKSVTLDGAYVVINTVDLPDHKSPYYSDSTKYEAYNGSNSKFNLNPNRIASQNITFRIPVSPKEASTKTATPGGAFGISLNGVVIFNQYAAMQAALTSEINSFDQYGGHPQQSGVYHYHVEPTYTTTKFSKSVLLGFLLDGFPIYGPVENGKTLTSADLDKYHGHSHATTDYPDGIYHYHFTSDTPYLNGDGFFGTAGTVSQ